VASSICLALAPGTSPAAAHLSPARLAAHAAALGAATAFETRLANVSQLIRAQHSLEVTCRMSFLFSIFIARWR